MRLRKDTRWLCVCVYVSVGKRIVTGILLKTILIVSESRNTFDIYRSIKSTYYKVLV